MFLFVCLCIKVYVCMFEYFCIYQSHSIQRFKLCMADKIPDIDNSINAISTKVTHIDSSLD